MPIVEIKKSKQLEFGFGDIEVIPGLLKSDDTVGAVCFVQRITPNEIGEHTDYGKTLEIELEDTPVRMIFDKTESIDVVIWALEEVKKKMIAKKEN